LLERLFADNGIQMYMVEYVVPEEIAQRRQDSNLKPSAPEAEGQIAQG